MPPFDHKDDFSFETDIGSTRHQSPEPLVSSEAALTAFAGLQR